MSYLTIALSKGRLTDLTIEMFEKAGLDCTELKSKTRKLILFDEKNKVRFLLAKPSDVPTYVEYGTADIGIVGKDTLMEEGRNLYEVLDLGFAKCRMCVAGPSNLKDVWANVPNKRVCTKYPRIAKDYFEHKRGESVEIIKLNGSVELGPLTGLSDIIVDLVESGRTLVENGLIVYDDVAEISARMVVNRVSMKMRNDKISRIIDSFTKQLKEREEIV